MLDRRRQLLAVRRDNVEHLIMIGGPSDLVIEPDFTATSGHDPYEIGESWPGNDAPVTARFGWIGSYIQPASRIFIGPGLFQLAVVSGIAGAGAGLICGLFRWALGTVDRFRISLPVVWHGEPLLGCSLLIAGAAVAAAFSAWLVRRFSEHAIGSGIPQVEAVINCELPPAPFILLPVKFIGGLLAIGAGFALGREGPSVQMGATIAHLLGKTLGRNAADCRSLLAAGAGAGLAAAFNAPFAGAAFVLEELTRKFDTREAVAALGASGSAIVVVRLLTGPASDFIVTNFPYPELGDNLLCIGLGVIAGLLGVVYNRVLFGALAIADRLAGWPVEFAPRWSGRRSGRSRRLLRGWLVAATRSPNARSTAARRSHSSPSSISFALSRRGSYAAGTPGGLFAPLLVFGAQMGFIFGGLVNPGMTDPPPMRLLSRSWAWRPYLTLSYGRRSPECSS